MTIAVAGGADTVRQERLLQSLASRLSLGGTAPRHVETHISHVLLHAGTAYKFKKPLATPFLDQSTLERRRAACAEEVRLNRRLAPQIYLDVVPITGTPDGPVLGGTGPAIEYAVRMRAFDEDGLWERLAARGALRAEDVDDLAALLSRFHSEAAQASADSAFGSPSQVRPALLDCLRDLRGRSPDGRWPGLRESSTLTHLRQWEAEVFPRLGPAMAVRLKAGRVREGHGDLHLGNVVREAGRSLAFDGIEFDPGLRWIDVMSDVGFMAMDLQAHGLGALANRFLDTYLQLSGDYDGMSVFGYYLVQRALVRARVAHLRASQTVGVQRNEALESARRYLAQASCLTVPRRRALLITHGLSGSGKTTLTQGLLEAIGAPRVRADVERKRLASMTALQKSHSVPGGGLYGAAMNEATQRHLLMVARSVLDSGWPVILDATFLRRADRDAARQCAEQLGVAFAILDFAVPLDVLRERVRRRSASARDASEADERVLALQVQQQEPLGTDELGAVHTVRLLREGSGDPPCADWAPLLACLGFADSGTGTEAGA